MRVKNFYQTIEVKEETKFVEINKKEERYRILY